jgi:hypothetical protein
MLSRFEVEFAAILFLPLFVRNQKTVLVRTEKRHDFSTPLIDLKVTLQLRQTVDITFF